MKYKIKTGFKDSPGGIVDKDPPANAGHTNCRPLAAGRLSPFPQLLSLCCGTCEPQLPKPVRPRAHAL